MVEYSKRNIRTWSMLGSRRLLGTVLEELASTDEKFIFITADVGRYYAINRYIEKYPNRIINVGIAEQNMIGVAAGLAKEGFHPMVATYATFATSRVLDQIRVNMGLMKLGIVVLGVSAGLVEGDMSATHMGLEDIADIMAIPNIDVISPADCTESVKAMIDASRSGRPTYVRLTGGFNEPIVYRDNYDFNIGKSIILKEGRDVIIAATGTMVSKALRVADMLSELGIMATVVDVNTIRPMDSSFISLIKNYRFLVSLEEHSVYGGLGSVIDYAMAKFDKKPKHLLIGTDKYVDAMQYDDLLNAYGMQPEQIKESIIKFINSED